MATTSVERLCLDFRDFAFGVEDAIDAFQGKPETLPKFVRFLEHTWDTLQTALRNKDFKLANWLAISYLNEATRVVAKDVDEYKKIHQHPLLTGEGPELDTGKGRKVTLAVVEGVTNEVLIIKMSNTDGAIEYESRITFTELERTASRDVISFEFKHKLENDDRTLEHGIYFSAGNIKYVTRKESLPNSQGDSIYSESKIDLHQAAPLHPQPTN